MMDNHIIPECYLDTNMMESLLPTNKGYNHQKGCHTVAKVMQEKFGDKFAVGIIDKDKITPVYLKQFKQLVAKYNVELYKHPIKHHYLILHPVIEDWLVYECEQVNLLMKDYNLPNNTYELEKHSKPVTSKNDERFKRLFKALKKNNAQGITLLFEWTDYLINNPYNADETILINKGNAS